MDDIENPSEPANLRFLRRLVTVLTATMILGVLTVIVLLVIRLNASTPAAPPLPDQITLPDGSIATAFTVGSDWYGVVTMDDTILIFDRVTGALRQTITLTDAQ